MARDRATRTRRQFLQDGLLLASVGLLGGCGLLPAPARQPAAVHRLGYLSGRGAVSEAANLEGLRRGMRDLGYVEGRDFTLETRFAEGQVERSPELAAELVRFPVELIVAVGIVPPRAAKDATSTIPIVMATSNDAARFGLVASLARPGGNVTGLTSITTQLNGKRLELLKEAMPGVSRVAVLWNPAISERATEFPEVEAAAQALGLQVISLEAREPSEFEAAFDAASGQRAEALLTLDNALLAANRGQLAERVTKSRLPTISDGRLLVDAAGLMAYGPDQVDQHRQAAVFVDKILKGAKPADLPIEQPTKFVFVINLKTARDLGLSMPQSMLQQATEIVQ
jgi:putative ABC transport system substrate-binding protein